MNVKVHTYCNSIELNNKVVHTLPDELLSIQKAVEKSKYILDLQENWDDEGAEAYTEATWIKAVSFLCEFSIDTLKTFGKTPLTPKIYHGQQGSIDILWKSKELNLLLNIPKGDEAATFSGENSLEQAYEGSLNTTNYSLSFLPHPF